MLLNNENRTIEVVNSAETRKDDLIDDMVAVIYSFAARMYSRRRAKKVAECVKNGLGWTTYNQKEQQLF